MPQTKMSLTPEQEAVLNGSKGETMAKIMKTLVMYGETFGAEKLVPVTGKMGHLVTSFGLGVMKPVYTLMDKLIAEGCISGQQFSVDPMPLDKNVPASPVERLVFKKFMYSAQNSYDQQLARLGLLGESAYTCACYLPEVGNTPKEGEVLSWAESSAVAFANSVLGARCNRNSGIIELFGSIAGWVPYFGLLTDEGRRAAWVVDVTADTLPEAQILGSAVGMKVMEDVPYVRGLSRFFPEGLTEDAVAYLKDFGAAAASNGAVGLYHIEGLTPEAVRLGDALIAEGAQSYTVDAAELDRVRKSYPVIWKDPNAKPKLCFVGCPHLTFGQLNDWTEKVCAGLQASGRKKVAVPTVFTAPPDVITRFGGSENARRLAEAGVVLSPICPLMYMNNPLCGKKPVITNSNKLRTYTSARYHTSEEILSIITKGVK